MERRQSGWFQDAKQRLLGDLQANRGSYLVSFSLIALLIVILGLIWVVTAPTPYRSTGDGALDAVLERYEYPADLGCTEQELASLATDQKYQARQRECSILSLDHRRELDDLTQQTRAAEAVEKSNWYAGSNFALSRWQLLMSAAGALFLAYALKLNRDSTRAASLAVAEAQRANRIATENAFIERRPWVAISDPVLNGVNLVDNPMDGMPQQAMVNFTVSVENLGKTPAVKGWWTIKAFNQAMGQRPDQRALDAEVMGEGGGSKIILPSGRTEETRNEVLDFEVPENSPHGLFQLGIFVGYTYQSFGDDERRHSSAYFYLNERDTDNRILPGIVVPAFGGRRSGPTFISRSDRLLS